MRKGVILGICFSMVLLVVSNDAQAKRGKDDAKENKAIKTDVSSQAPASTRGQQTKPKQIKLDRNHDGKVDRIEIYAAKGIIVESQTDTNGDTKIDEWVFYKKAKPVRAKKDINGDGIADTTSEYDTKGIIVKSETDANGDTKIDEWVYYENGKPVRAEKDTNGDGKPDTWVEY